MFVCHQLVMLIQGSLACFMHEMDVCNARMYAPHTVILCGFIKLARHREKMLRYWWQCILAARAEKYVWGMRGCLFKASILVLTLLCRRRSRQQLITVFSQSNKPIQSKT